MRYRVAAAALCFATPALATSGLDCRPVSGRGPELSLVVGHGAGPAVAGARLDGRQARVAQGWIDSQRVWVDLVDGQAMRYEAKLRAAFQPKLRGRPAFGTLVRNGRTWQVRCVES